MEKKKIKIVSRSSKLAIIQANEIIEHFPEVDFGILAIESLGDKRKDISLLEDAPADFFTRELDEVLINEKADIAVHSAKDLPYPLSDELEVIALTEAVYRKDVLYSFSRKRLNELPENAKIGTSSKARKEQLLAVRPDLQTVSIRGTIEERIALVNKGEIYALIVAECALRRLELDHLIVQQLPFDSHPQQGSLAVVAKKGNAFLKSLFSKIDIRRSYGKVHISGFGPGSSDLMTIRAWRALQSADVVFYDDLIDKTILSTVQGKCVYTGKRKDKHSMPQGDINNLLLEAARLGKKVVRLKGGDPQIFGRGGEEFDFLHANHIEVEVIPGITSAIAAAASIGVPLTHRESASSVAFLTGHSEKGVQVPDADTLVYYMGATNLKTIGQSILDAGRSKDTPVALVHDATSANQKELYTNLGDLATKEFDMPSPLIVIVGNTVRNKNYKPNEKRKSRVLVTGSKPEKYHHLGDVVHSPLIDIEPLNDYGFLKEKLPRQHSFDWLIFTSPHAVKYFVDALFSIGYDLRWIGEAKIISIGQTTTNELERYKLIPDRTAELDSSEGIIELFIEYNLGGKKILIPRSDLAKDTIPTMLGRLGFEVTAVPIYTNQAPESYVKEDLEKIDIVVFSSPSTVRNFKRIYGKLPKHMEVITRGDVTDKALYESGLREFNDWVI